MRRFTFGLFALLLLVPAQSALAQKTDLPGNPDIPANPSGPLLPGAFAGTFSFTAADPLAPTRLFRDGVPSDCVAPKAFPGTFGGPNRYRTFAFTNGGPETCVTVNLDVGTCGTDVHLIAYSGPFDPNDFSAGYLGDVGSSVTQPFSFVVPVNSPVTIVAIQNQGLEIDCDFSFSSSQLLLPGEVPTMNGPMLLVLLAAVLGAGVFLSRRRIAGTAV
jgi:hypothetical protein